MTATEWFELYGESHRNPINKAIHWLCIPLIVWATLGLFQSIPFPFGAGVSLHWGTLVVAAALVFYARLSWTIAAGMATVSISALALNAWLVGAGVNLLALSLGSIVELIFFGYILP